jgi:hypothetical protein
MLKVNEDAHFVQYYEESYVFFVMLKDCKVRSDV